MERPIDRVLALRPKCLGHVDQRHNRSRAVIDLEFAHVILPMHMRIEQSRDDEFAAKIEHLRARRRSGVRGKLVSNGVPLDQQRVISQRRVGQSVDDR
jgi:hypothetical protein